MQYTVGKKSFAAIIFLLVIIIFLLVAILALNLISKDIFTNNTRSNKTGLSNVNSGTCNATINSNLSLIQNKIDDLMEQCATKNSSILLQNNVEYIMKQINDHNINSNLSMIQNTVNINSLLLQNTMDNNSLIMQNRIDFLTKQLNNINISSNLSLIQKTLDHIIQQIMIHVDNTNRSTDELLQLLNTSLIKDISIPTATAVNNILLIVNELQNGSSAQPVSCNNIKTAQPSSPSGYYQINNHNIYCNMGELCGQEGGWTRIAYLNATDNCPSGFEALVTGGIRVCRREGDSDCCRSNIFQTHGISYSQICGKVVGYQKGTPNGVNTNVNDINSAYIDGVSITRGSPRQHVWSYIAGFSSNINSGLACPCNSGGTHTTQSFVGEHYYCESGINGTPDYDTVYTADPLWDGKNCLSNEAPCCTGTGLPWFFRDYGNATITDFIELRTCASNGWSDEDIPVQSYEIYVK